MKSSKVNPDSSSPFQVGQNVIVEDFGSFDHEWTGTIVGFRNGYVQVMDSDDDVYEIKSVYLTID